MNAEWTLLLDDRLAPITDSIGFIQGECAFVSGKFIEWQEELRHRFSFIKMNDVRTIPGDLEQVLRSLLPLRQGQSNRFVFIPTTGGWTAYFGNNYRGTDPSAIAYLADLSGGLTVWVVAKPYVPRRRPGGPRQGRNGALIMDVTGPEETDWLNRIRTIRLENHIGRWEFSQSGQPFAFEDTERYRSRSVRKRFDFGMLKRYLEGMGLSAFDENFYLPSNSHGAILVEQETHDSNSRDVSLAEARRLNGIE